MKTNYQKPTTKVVLIQGGHELLSGSGVKATMSGYGHDDNSEDGFKEM